METTSAAADGGFCSLMTFSRNTSPEVPTGEPGGLDAQWVAGIGQRLATARSLEGIGAALESAHPDVVCGDALWGWVRSGATWAAVTPVPSASVREMQHGLAEQVWQRTLAARVPGDGVVVNDHLCFALVADDVVVGVLGLRLASFPGGPLPRPTVSIVATMVALAVRHVQLARQLHDHVVHDGLTGCFNRTQGMQGLAVALQQAHETGGALALLMFDLDHFKRVNDHYGHLCGDAVLTVMGTQLHQAIRETAVRCRYGGDEFLVAVPDVTATQAVELADRVRRGLADTAVRWNGATVAVTVSGGVAMLGDRMSDVRTFVGRADTALYQAKADGRNRVRLATQTHGNALMSGRSVGSSGSV